MSEEPREITKAEWSTWLSRGESQWQDISAAPKDGTEIVGHDSATDTRHVTFWSGRWHDPDDHYYGTAPEFKPTHWMPLPSAPDLKPLPTGEGV